MALFLSAIVAFLTWLMLGFVGADPMSTMVGAALVFLAVCGTMVHYVLSCMRRHCRHGTEHTANHHHHHGAMR